jgi:hypothetical protein
LRYRVAVSWNAIAYGEASTPFTQPFSSIVTSMIS